MNLQKLIIFLGLSLFLASCGKKKEATRQEAPVATQTPQPAGTPQSAPESVPPDVKVSDKAEKTRVDNSKEAPKPVTDIANKGVKTSEEVSLKMNGRGNINDRKVPVKTSSKTMTKVIPSQVSDKKVKVGESLASSGAANKLANSLYLTGGISDYGLYYTTIANDGVFRVLQELVAEKTADEIEKDIAFSQSIYDAQFLIDRKGNLTVDVSLRIGKGFEERRFVAPYDKNQLMVVNLDSIKMTAECIDLNKRSEDCYNMIVTLEKSGAETKIVLRQSGARLDYQMDLSEDSDFNELAQYLRNSNLDVQTSERVATINVYSFEVLNGKSAQTTVLMGVANQVLSFKSELTVKKDLSPSLNNVDKAQDWNDLYLEKARFTKDMKFQSMIKSAKLTENNGKGQFSMDVMFESKVSKSQNRIKFKMTRELVPTNF